ncbi:hypothetical protein F2Q70_00027221 [Brassica cretica]|uniref:Uncharacterized protein n=1 Tax=Brassica cretica TaxID=69181 RepID=A0A8S9L2S1_BRACR|nr:hypothetical protein F2Q70_00027221 [Brassica cretica]
MNRLPHIAVYISSPCQSRRPPPPLFVVAVLLLYSSSPSSSIAVSTKLSRLGLLSFSSTTTASFLCHLHRTNSSDPVCQRSPHVSAYLLLLAGFHLHHPR